MTRLARFEVWWDDEVRLPFRKFLCRFFGHKPSVETTAYGCLFFSPSIGGEPGDAFMRKDHVISRFCPRCFETENSVQIVDEEVRLWVDGNTIMWSEQEDPYKWDGL
ncbi:MAG: hypothetical protein KAJ55_00270 [Anaerolineales bacterium]|nr:hypothetical protein [Anaerolineales bacterium]